MPEQSATAKAARVFLSHRNIKSHQSDLIGVAAHVWSHLTGLEIHALSLSFLAVVSSFLDEATLRIISESGRVG
jgi:hypothetical protein